MKKILKSQLCDINIHMCSKDEFNKKKFRLPCIIIVNTSNRTSSEIGHWVLVYMTNKRKFNICIFLNFN